MITRARYSQFRPGVVWFAGFALAWAEFAFPGTVRAQVKADDAATVVGRMRQAAGLPVGTGRPAELLIEGKVDRSGTISDYTLRFNSAGMFLQTVTGPLPGSIGSNGKECWWTDLSGMPERLALHDLDRNTLWLGMHTGQWLARADAASVALAKAKGPRDEVVLNIKQGRMKAKLYVSRATWLPVSLESSDVSGPETWTFADYHSFAGLKVPGTLTLKQAGQTETYRVGSMRPAPAAPASVYDFVATRPDDTKFDPAASPDLVVKIATTGHALVRPKVDGQEIGWFMFDTGAAGTMIDPTAVAKLKLKSLSSTAVTSPRGNEQSSILQGASLALGPMTIAKPYFVTMDLAYVRDGTGDDVVGIVGYDILSRCVAEITLADDSIKLFDPKGYRLERGSWQPLILNQSVPVVAATFEGGHKGVFRIDVGSSGPNGVGNVIFHAPTVSDLHLLKGRKLDRMKLGPSKVAMSKIAWFELAGHRFDNPKVVFAIDRQGPLGDEYLEGNIGVDFLKPFHLVLDLPSERVAFVPRGKDR
jgi:Aspartyl protease